MRDRIVAILGGLRRRMLLVRAVEAAAVAAVASALTAAALMAGWILAGRFELAAVGLCAAPAAAGVVLAAAGRVRGALHGDRLVQWAVIAILCVCSFAGMLFMLTGTYVRVPKDWLFLILPVGALVTFVITLIRGVAPRQAAIWVDRRAGLRERLSTAFELGRAGEQLPFARAVRDQALAAAGRRDLRRVGFWSRTRATGGALGLAVIAAALMVLWEPLESHSARQQRRWGEVSRQAGESLQRRLAAMESEAAADSPIGEQLRRLEKLAGSLSAARPGDEKQWRGKVVELDRIADDLRRAVRAGTVDAETAERIGRLIHALEQVAAGIAEGMGEGGGTEYAGSENGGDSPSSVAAVGSRPARPERAQGPWCTLTVYDPRYAALAATAPAETSPGAGEPGTLQIPYDKAWAAARRRAAKAVETGSLPAEYRQLVRDFFDTDR